jgi:type VI secretion system protein ImpG
VNPRLLYEYYERELKHVGEMGAEFAREYPKIAGRLGLESLPCADPYVERLLEGFAFMAARIQLRMDARFPRFTHHLLQMLAPHYLAPIPSMAIVRFQPALSDPALAEGFSLPRDTVLRSTSGRGDHAACVYRTAHGVDVWPIELTEARYFPTASALANVDVPVTPEVRAGIRLRFRCTSGPFDALPLSHLPLYLPGGSDLPRTLYEQLLAHAVGIVVRPKGGAKQWQVRLPAEHLQPVGFSSQEALLPYTRRSFDGYRLLQEYFAFPKRFFFVEFRDLQEPLRRCASTELELLVLTDQSVSWMEPRLTAEDFALFCTPVANLFPKRADRINVDRTRSEYHVVSDRTRPMDFEIHSVLGVDGFAGGQQAAHRFRSFYTARDPSLAPDEGAYFTISREPTALSARQRRQGPRSSYIGQEVFLQIVDAREIPFSPDLKQLEVHTLCTNRDLPLQLSLGSGATDFALDIGAPVESVRVLDGLSEPQASPVHRESAWQLLSHLSLNYVGLLQEQEDGQDGARLIRDMLSLYAAEEKDRVRAKLIEGVRSVTTAPIVRRLPVPGPVAFARGLEITLTCDDEPFEGTGVFLFGAVMEAFLTRFVGLNSFTETVLRTPERGEIKRWPARLGRRPVL